MIWKGSRPRAQELHRTGAETPLSKGTHKISCAPGNREKPVTPEQPGPGPPTGLGGFAGEAEVGRGSPRTKGHWWQRTQGTPICVSSHRGHRFGTESWLHSTGHRFQCWHAAGQTTNSENTVPPMSRQAAQSLLSQRPPINTLFDMVLPTEGLDSAPPTTEQAPAPPPPGSLQRLLNQAHPQGGGNIRRKKNCNPKA